MTNTKDNRMYRIEDVVIEGTDQPIQYAISAVDGSFIGTEDFAKMLVDEMGIAPQAPINHKTACIGFCQKEQKWYGWSHRAIYGYGIGSTVTKGDSAYVPKDMEDFVGCAVAFYDDEYADSIYGEPGTDHEGHDGVWVRWTYSHSVPNERLRGEDNEVFMHAPVPWGRGEWTAETLADARKMAEDFAESVG